MIFVSHSGSSVLETDTVSRPAGRDFKSPWDKRQERMKTLMRCLILLSIRAQLDVSDKMINFISVELTQHVG